MVHALLKQLKKRRKQLGLKQIDMMMRIGVSRQQYQRLESKGNPRLDTLELIAKGLNSELMFIPKEKVNAVIAVLENVETDNRHTIMTHMKGQSASKIDPPKF
ncbi:MAG: XRE family transcriptional regulator [Geobacteraceae bacterium]|nr:MAG: XRE family transcriptional regulator [Geobacteraceae bacterium]